MGQSEPREPGTRLIARAIPNSTVKPAVIVLLKSTSSANARFLACNPWQAIVLFLRWIESC
jgi:hypothetical protein